MALTNIAMAEMLSALVQLDISAVYAYRHTIAIVGPGSVRNQLIRFHTDHERHIQQLSAVIRALDFEPPLLSSDLDDRFTQGVSTIQLLTGPESSLYAIKVNEELTNLLYRESSFRDLTPSIKELVSRNYEDEQRHLRFMEEVVATLPQNTKSLYLN